MSKPHIYDLDYNTLISLTGTWHGSQYAAEVWRYLYRECVCDFHAMLSLPQKLRYHLSERLSLTQLTDADLVVSDDGNTRKDLLVLEDGQSVEVVLLRYRERFSACISTQVGCACGCVFCATGQMGFVRQLSAGEIIAQVVYLQRVLKREKKTLSNIVFMGMGEPLLNYDATLSAVHRFTESRGFGIGPKRITLSTVGIAPEIRRLAEEPVPIKLAVSLHAATDALRSSLMPINRRYPLETLWQALKFYTSTTGRRIFLEWVMIKEVNDTPQAALSLVSWVRDIPAHVNLIQLNASDSFSGQSSTDDAAAAFTAVLDLHKIPHTMRQRRGVSINAGCGQLRQKLV